MNRPVHTPVLKPPSLPEKTCFLFASGPDCLHAQDTLTEVVLARGFSTRSHVAFGGVYCSAYIF